MEKNLVLKTVALGVMVFGAFTIGTAVYARFKRKKDEQIIADTLIEKDVIKQSFSGAAGVHNTNGGGAVFRNTGKPCTTFQGNHGTVHINGWGAKSCVGIRSNERTTMPRNVSPTRPIPPYGVRPVRQTIYSGGSQPVFATGDKCSTAVRGDVPNDYGVIDYAGRCMKRKLWS